MAYREPGQPPYGDEEMKVRVRRGRVVDMSKTMDPEDADGENLGIVKFGPEGARLLVERGAEVNSASRNQMKVMPLHSAVATNDPDARYEIVELLLRAGADPNAVQQDRFTPLMAADHHGDERLRAILVEHGATG
jgi:ankyrin repeat protein